MKSYNSLTILLLIGLLTAGLTIESYAQRTNRPMRNQSIQQGQFMMNRPGMARGLISQLDLSDEQQEEIKSIMLDTRRKITPLRSEMREERARLHTLITSSDADMAAINQQTDKIGKLRTQIMKEQMAKHRSIRNVLNDEQQVWFDSRPRLMGRGGRGGINKGGGMMRRPGRGLNRGMSPRGVCPWMQ